MPTTVVVPISKARPNERSLVSPPSTQTNSCPTTTAVTCHWLRRKTPGNWRNRLSDASIAYPSGSSASRMRLKSLRWSSNVGGVKVRGILLTLELRITCRSTPISAALGFPISRGTWQTTSELASLRQESRQPSASSSSVKILRSAAVAPFCPSRMRTLHLPQVPLAPQVLSMGRPIQFAALKIVIPGGTRVTLSWGRNSMETLVVRVGAVIVITANADAFQDGTE